MSDSVTVGDGKYTVKGLETGDLRAERNGEPWQSLVGNNLVYCLASELDEERIKNEDLNNLYVSAKITIEELEKSLDDWKEVASNERKEMLRLQKIIIALQKTNKVGVLAGYFRDVGKHDCCFGNEYETLDKAIEEAKELKYEWVYIIHNGTFLEISETQYLPFGTQGY